MAAAPRDFVYFKAQFPQLSSLSNFATLAAGLRLRAEDVTNEMLTVCPSLRTWLAPGPAIFSSSEALWQALKARNVFTFRAFTADGRFGQWSLVFFEAVYGATIAADKLKFWRGCDAVGIVAKLASNPAYRKKLGLAAEDLDYAREHLDPGIEQSVWLTILKLKFQQNSRNRECLIGTGVSTLIEFEKSAQRSGSHWGGLVSKKDGLFYGENVMGRYLMLVRDMLL